MFKNQRFAAKFTGKHLCWSLNCNETEGWEISQNLQESTCSGALFLLKLQATLREKCPNTEVFLVRIFPYSDWIPENTDQKKLSIWTLFTQCYRHNINTKSTRFYQKPNLFAPFTKCTLTHNWKLQ